MDDFRNNGKKKNLREYILKLSEELLNRISSVFKCVNIVYVLCKDSLFRKSLMGYDGKKRRCLKRHNKQINEKASGNKALQQKSYQKD